MWEFAKHGTNRGILVHGGEGLYAAKKGVESYGGKMLAIPTNVGYVPKIESVIIPIEKEFGLIDV
ncbi:MAG: hypothetical protein EPN39_07540 [Chitinophagaceae bacterium]|nr:MAG: hypothetical protein EPN39_07540 [Chitinophagaceae bacterium]